MTTMNLLHQAMNMNHFHRWSHYWQSGFVDSGEPLQSAIYSIGTHAHRWTTP